MAALTDLAFRHLAGWLDKPPDAAERERIWRVQVHPGKTPLAPDVDFVVLAEQFPRSGGDIKNAVLKAAQIATTEPGLKCRFTSSSTWSGRAGGLGEEVVVRANLP